MFMIDNVCVVMIDRYYIFRFVEVGGWFGEEVVLRIRVLLWEVCGRRRGDGEFVDEGVLGEEGLVMCSVYDSFL